MQSPIPAFWLTLWLLSCNPFAHAQTPVPALLLQVQKLQQEGKFGEALPLAQEAVRLAQTSGGDLAAALNGLAYTHFGLKQFKESESLFARALEIREKTLGLEHPDTVASLTTMAEFYFNQGDYRRAEPLYLKALAIREKVLGPDHPQVGNSLDRLGTLYFNQGDLTRAEDFFVRALAVRRKGLQTDNEDLLTSQNNLAAVYVKKGDFAGAETLFVQTLTAQEKALGPTHPKLANTLENLALLYNQQAHYAKAENLYSRALSIREKSLGPDHHDLVVSLMALGGLYSLKTDYLRAESLFTRALTIREKALGPNHPAVAASLNRLGLNYFNKHEGSRSESLFLRALAIQEKALGPDDPSVAESLNNLARLYLDRFAYGKAEPLLVRALAIREKNLGPDSPDLAVSLHNLAFFYKSQEAYAKAGPLFERALTIVEKSLGPDHPLVGDVLANLAFNQLAEQNMEGARALARRAELIQTKASRELLSYSSERQRLSYFKNQEPCKLLATLGDPRVLEPLLNYKGIVLDSLLEDRALSGHGREQLQALKTSWSSLAIESSKTAQRKQLEEQIENLQASLGAKVTRRSALAVSVDQVQNALPPGSALVEYVLYPHWIKGNAVNKRYGAIVLPPQGPPIWVALNASQEVVQKDLDAYRLLVAGQAGRGATRLKGAPQVEEPQTLRRLYNQLWEPVEQALPKGTKQVILSPDGNLNFLSFATLVASDGQFLAEKHPISYVASGRDLVSSLTPRTSNRHLALIYNPTFVSDAPTLAASGEPPSKRDLDQTGFLPLPGTDREGQLLKELAKSKGLTVDAAAQKDASETRLKQLDSPWILHLATHGFFLPVERSHEAPTLASDKQAVYISNPMLRSGMALAGAQSTLEQWRAGKVPNAASDGILTAEEAGTLHLQGTWLVTLSACDTGSGQSSSGEGVLGLRRGFMMAGTQNLLLTLWPVADEETADFMLEFYRRALQSGNAPEALAEVQTEALVSLRKTLGLHRAVQLAGPFVLTFRGKP